MARKSKPTEVKEVQVKKHGNDKYSQEKREQLMELIKRDVSVESACAYCRISKQTFYDRMDKDAKLADDYQYAKNYLDIASSNVIAKAIVDEKSIKDSRERKKRRDRRYADKQDNMETIIQTTIDYAELKDKSPQELDEIRRQLLG